LLSETSPPEDLLVADEVDGTRTVGKDLFGSAMMKSLSFGVVEDMLVEC
jgi:hypothetical protein